MVFRWKAVSVGLLLTVAISACGTQRDVAWPENRPLGATTPAYKPPVEPDDQDAEEVQPPAPVQLTLADAVGRTLQMNPSLRAAGWNVRAREAQTLQAGLWPNPELEGDMAEFGGSDALAGTDAAEIGVRLSQQIPLGGDVGARKRLAAGERDLAGWGYEARRLDVLTETAQGFAAVFAAQERLKLADTLLALAQTFEHTVAERADAGKVSPVEATRASVVRANAQINRDRVRHELVAARRSLSALWGEHEPEFQQVVGEFPDIRPLPALDAVVALVDRNPDLARWATELMARQSNLDVARGEGFPDPSLTFGASRFNELGDTGLFAGLSIPIPVFDRKQGNVQEARYRIREAEALRDAAVADVRRRLSEAYELLAAAHGMVTKLEAEVLPAASKNFLATEEGYREGKFDLLTLLDAQRTLYEASNRYVDAGETYLDARAEVERLIGTSLTDIPNQ